MAFISWLDIELHLFAGKTLVAVIFGKVTFMRFCSPFHTLHLLFEARTNWSYTQFEVFRLAALERFTIQEPFEIENSHIALFESAILFYRLERSLRLRQLFDSLFDLFLVTLGVLTSGTSSSTPSISIFGTQAELQLHLYLLLAALNLVTAGSPIIFSASSSSSLLALFRTSRRASASAS
ncbi:hypothetical protein NNO_0088 [Hydrogenimonas sp.]|nr:hypothetical protein NNO_0088 [Hydrogenimonas sp.]